MRQSLLGTTIYPVCGIPNLNSTKIFGFLVQPAWRAYNLFNTFVPRTRSFLFPAPPIVDRRFHPSRERARALYCIFTYPKRRRPTETNDFWVAVFVCAAPAQCIYKKTNPSPRPSHIPPVNVRMPNTFVTHAAQPGTAGTICSKHRARLRRYAARCSFAFSRRTLRALIYLRETHSTHTLWALGLHHTCCLDSLLFGPPPGRRTIARCGAAARDMHTHTLQNAVCCF